jgi:hypothetical protein
MGEGRSALAGSSAGEEVLHDTAATHSIGGADSNEQHRPRLRSVRSHLHNFRNVLPFGFGQRTHSSHLGVGVGVFLNLQPREKFHSAEGSEKIGSPDIGTYAAARTGNAELCPRLIPSRLILEIKVVRGRPSRAAAPSRPPTAPSVCSRV